MSGHKAIVAAPELNDGKCPSPPWVRKNWAHYVERALKRLGYSRRALASLLDVDPSLVSLWLRGQTPRREHAERLGRELDEPGPALRAAGYIYCPSDGLTASALELVAALSVLPERNQEAIVNVLKSQLEASKTPFFDRKVENF